MALVQSTNPMNTYFLTAAQRQEIIDEAVMVDCQSRDDLEPAAYRAELESMNNYELVQCCCNW